MISEVKALRWVVEHDRMAFRSHVHTEDVRAGDPFVLYVTRGAYHNPTSGESQVLGLGRFTSEVQSRRATVHGETFPKSASIKVEAVLAERSGMPFKPLVDDLSFIAKKAGWPAYLRSSLVRVSEADVQVIRSAFQAYRRAL